MRKLIPAKLEKSDGGEFRSFLDASVKKLNLSVAGTITARYYKGLGADNDNLVIVADDEPEN